MNLIFELISRARVALGESVASMNNEMVNELTVVRVLRAEDIAAGMYVAVLSETHEVFPPVVFDVLPGQSVKPFRVTCTGCADGEAKRVLSVCLPFVQAETAAGDLVSLDVRRHTLAALSEVYGLEAFTRPRRKSWFEE
ncbi:MAG: hypothetical protein JNK16_10395 [Phycisphaerales bacterium]|nr:hypothetical protein [Phycisphaerales bacterium]